MDLKKPKFAVLRLFLSGMMLSGNVTPLFPASLLRGLGMGGAAFAASLLFSAKKAWALETIQLQHPSPALFKPFPNFSANPADEEFKDVHYFEEPLIPTSTCAIPGENRALAEAIREDLSSEALAERDEELSRLDSFTRLYCGSRWVLSVELNRGLLLEDRGYFTKAVEAFQRAWVAGKTEGGQAKPLADRALVELIRINARLGHRGDVENLLKLMQTRQPTGLVARYSLNAEESLWYMQHEPAVSFRCGPFALGKILEFEKSKQAQSPLLWKSYSTEKGFSLSRLERLSRKLGMGLQAAKRAPGTPLTLPALVHWKLGHYAAIVEEKNGLYHTQDPTFGNENWISEKALDEESSGYYLVKAGHLPCGWRPVGGKEAGQVWGGGNVAPNPNEPPTCGQTLDCPICNSCGMPVAHIDLGMVAARIEDTPLNYTPPVGPKMDFKLTYHSQTSPGSMPFSNFGPNWSFNWQSTIQYTYTSNSNHVAQPMGFNLFPPGGGVEPVSMVSQGTSWVSQYNTQYTRSVIYSMGTTQFSGVSGLPVSFVRQMPDGTVEHYDVSSFTGAAGTLLLTSVVDPQGNAVSLIYDSTVQGQLDAIQDAAGQVTRFSYGSPLCPTLITGITDPFGRTAVFNYSSAGPIAVCGSGNGNGYLAYTVYYLSSITDQLGLTSSFNYGLPGCLPNPFICGTTQSFGAAITSMTTPYGTTTFSGSGNFGGSFPHEMIVTDPMGLKMHALFQVTQNQDPPDFGNAPVPNSFFNDAASLLNYRNTYFWDKKAIEEGLDGNADGATIYEWLHSQVANPLQSYVLETLKRPLENREWYAHQGQTDSVVEATPPGTMLSKPTTVARVLSDGTVQLSQAGYNAFGAVTQTTDPKGRVMNYSYDTNGIDLLQVTDGKGEPIAAYGNYVNHQPGYSVDAAGQKTNYVYNKFGEKLSVIPPMGETTNYTYDSQGHLLSITPPQSGSGVTYTYDNVGRVATKSDGAHGTVTYHYDNFDRVTKIDYSDGTFEQYDYTKLDLTAFRDRQGRWTQCAYDNDQRIVSLTDPKLQTTKYGWCACGSITSIIDPNGNQTEFEYDLEKRLVKKIYADGSFYTYTYDPMANWLVSMTDPNNQTIDYVYDTDDKIIDVNYLNSINQTSNVSYTYNDPLGRLSSIVYETGTTSYTYGAFGQVGGGKTRTITSPVGSSTAHIIYTYDADGRVVNRSIDGVSEYYGYDNTAQLRKITNPLGVFGFVYSQGAQLGIVNYPNGQITIMDYFAPQDPLGASGSLREIKNFGTGGVRGGQVLSQFDYSYNPTGEVKSWQVWQGSVTNTYGMGYDADSELQSVKMTSGITGFDGLTPNQSVAYGYDAAGNRTSESAPSFLHTFKTNSLNQLTSEIENPIHVKGITSRPGSITVNATPVAEDSNNQYQTDIQPLSGTSTPLTIQALATDGSVTISRRNVPNTVNVAYDANGNLINDGVKTYSWDAENRLIQIKFTSPQPSNMADNIQFTYDGFDHCVGINEKHGSTSLINKTFVWCDDRLFEERDSNGSNVTKEFFDWGERIGAINYYFTKDRLISEREVTDGNGVVQSQYDYDPFGRQIKLAGTLDADFGYAGYYQEKAANLDLTWYRAYDPEKGRWLSRDPLGEKEGINLYSYVRNNTVRYIDRDGREAPPVVGIVCAIVIFGGVIYAVCHICGGINQGKNKCKKIDEALNNMITNPSSDPNYQRVLEDLEKQSIECHKKQNDHAPEAGKGCDTAGAGELFP